MRDEAGRQRVVIERVTPEIDGGRFPVKRVVGERVAVEADAFADGTAALSCRLLYWLQAATAWSQTPMQPLPYDRWRADFTVTEPGRWHYTVAGWVDPWKTWRRDLGKRIEAQQDVALDLRTGAALVRAAAERAGQAGRKADARVLAALADDLDPGAQGATAEKAEPRLRLALDAELALLMDRYADHRSATVHRELAVVVDRPRARFSSWYEMFPRSAGAAGRHGTFADAEARLPYIAGMGFDVLYLPPIHPIGHTARKGKDNAAVATPDDVGSPWAVGSEEGGHTAVHPELGTLDDFRR